MTNGLKHTSGKQPSITTTQIEELISGDATALHSHSGGGGAHASDHTDGTDDIQNATDTQKGLATAAQITKLDTVQASAVALATVKADSDVSDAISKKHTEAHTLASHSSMVGTGLIIENRTDDPESPDTGQIWLRTDL